MVLNMSLQSAGLCVGLTAELALVDVHVEVLPDVYDDPRALLRREVAPIDAAVVGALGAVRFAG